MVPFTTPKKFLNPSPIVIAINCSSKCIVNRFFSLLFYFLILWAKSTSKYYHKSPKKYYVFIQPVSLCFTVRQLLCVQSSLWECKSFENEINVFTVNFYSYLPTSIRIFAPPPPYLFPLLIMPYPLKIHKHEIFLNFFLT